ncbi:MAG TPA: zf-HC2 domain-containing protein [Bryobacteraceae bacterium]|nr:zf-HC2 domain-containing protein [Bryobacteraceae bacterium]
MEHDTKRCDEVFAMLSDYLNLELPPEACAEIGRHIEDCAPCVGFAESLRRTVELCAEYRPETMPPPLSEAARNELLEAWKRASLQRES